MTKVVLIAVATVFGTVARYLVPPLAAFVVLLALWGVSVLVGRLAEAWVKTRPLAAVWAFECGWLTVFVMVAMSTFIATQLGLWVPGWVTAVPEAEQKALAGVILGALSSLIGAFWLDNAKNKDGSLWPEARYRTALGAAFQDDERLEFPRDLGMEKLYAAVYLAPDPVNGISGWTFADRLARARVVAVFGQR